MNWFRGSVENVYLEECETPTREEEYKEIVDSTFGLLLDLEKASDDWMLLSNINGIQTFEKPDSSGFSCIKNQGILPGSPKFLFEKIWSDDLKQRQQWEADIKDLRVIENITNDIQVSYRSYSAPYPVAPREFVVVNSRRIFDNGKSYCIFGTSINHAFTNTEAKCVRGNCLVSGMIFRPVQDSPDKCSGIRIVHIDPKGMIPPWMVALSKKRAGQAFETLQKVIASIYVAEKEKKPQSISEKQNKSVQNEKEESGEEEEEEEEISLQKKNEKEEKSSEEDDEDYEEALESHIFDDKSSSQTKKISFEIPKKSHSTQQQSLSDLSRILTSIQSLLESLQIQTKTNGDRLAKIENALTKSAIPTLPPQPVVRTRVSIRSIRWNVWLFLILYPFVAIKLYEFLKKKFPNRFWNY